MGRLVRGFPVMQGVATTCCLSLGQGVVGSQGMGCSAFSPDRRGKGQHCCRERQLGRDYNTAVLRTWTRAPCYRGMLGRDCAQPWQRNLAPFSRIRIPDFHNTLSPSKSIRTQGAGTDCKPCRFLACSGREPQAAHALACPHTHITF